MSSKQIETGPLDHPVPDDETRGKAWNSWISLKRLRAEKKANMVLDHSKEAGFGGS